MYSLYEALLKERGVKTSEVAKATGIAPATFSDWKKGVYSPKQDKMQKIADYFGVPLSYFYPYQNNEDMTSDLMMYARKLQQLSPEAQNIIFDQIDYQISKSRRLDA